MNNYSFGRKLKFDASGNLLPSLNNTLNIGSANYRWKDLYLSGSTIDISGTRLSRHADGSLMVHDASGNYMPAKFSSVTTTANLGVGTDNPIYKMHVIGNTRIQGDLTVNGIQTIINTEVATTERIDVTNDGTGPALRVTQSGIQPIADFCDETSGNIVMRIADGGNVGIGTSNPQATLDVSGNIAITDGTASNPGFIFRSNTNTGFYRPGNNILGIVTGGNERIRIDATGNTSFTGNITASGNVGIGTTNPQAKLDVSGNIAITDGTASNPGLTFRSNTNTGFYRPGNNILGLVTGGNERIRIDASGNVGIGTNNPQTLLTIGNGPIISTNNMPPLHVYGTTNSTARFISSNSQQGNVSTIQLWSTFQNTADNGPRYSARITSGFNGGPWGNEYLTFGVGYNSVANDSANDVIERMRIDGTGNVGIGTTNPQAKLDVSGNIFCNGYISEAYTCIMSFSFSIPADTTTRYLYFSGLSPGYNFSIEVTMASYGYGDIIDTKLIKFSFVAAIRSNNTGATGTISSVTTVGGGAASNITVGTPSAGTTYIAVPIVRTTTLYGVYYYTATAICTGFGTKPSIISFG